MVSRMRMYGYPSGTGAHTKFKDNLEELAQEKLKELGDFPIWITSSTKDRIKNLQDDFLSARQNKKFNEEKGVEILKEIDMINKTLDIEEKQAEGIEARRKKSSRAKPKRKIIKKVIKRKK
jgi:hypothetical protein